MEVKVVDTPDQLEDAFFVRHEVFVKEQNVPPEEEIDEHESSATHFVLYDGKEPVGAGRLRILNGKGKIERICVLPAYRNKGAGKLIMKAIEEEARRKQLSKVVLNAQTHAIPFYERLHYKVISDEFMDAGIPHQTMEKML
jgi:predicted GNAT family N-acyltransferase